MSRTPNGDAMGALNRLVRYLIGCPRLVWTFVHQHDTQSLVTDVDANFAGCLATRRSTSGDVACRGQHLLKHWSSTQGTVTLSSAEAELTGICKGTSTSLGLISVASDLGFSWTLQIQTDATTATGVCRRSGFRGIPHRAVADVWVQGRLQQGEITPPKR